jgi:hypothetical protein
MFTTSCNFGFSLFVHALSHTCNTGRINYSLQCIYYKTQLTIRGHPPNIINNTKFKDQLDVQLTRKLEPSEQSEFYVTSIVPFEIRYDRKRANGLKYSEFIQFYEQISAVGQVPRH